MKNLIPLLIVFYCAPVIAEEDLETLAARDHIYKGCPLNSTCTKTVGSIRQKWSTALATKYQKEKLRNIKLNQFKNKYGIPLNIWIDGKKEQERDAIIWDSPCKQHSTKKVSIHIAEVFGKSFSQLLEKNKKTSSFLFGSSYHFNQKTKKITTYFIPRDTTPLYFDSKSLFFSDELEGNYFSYKISQQGKITIVSPHFPKETTEEVKCPKELVKFHKKHTDSRLYATHFCRSLYNIKTQKKETFLIGWSCY